MKITKAEIYKIQLPLAAPFRTGFGTISDREIVLVMLHDTNGTIGIGESANLELPVYEPEFNDGMIVLLKKYLIPNLIGKTIRTIEDLEATYASIRGNNFAKAAIEAAYWHLESQRRGKPLRTLWSGKKTTIPAALSIGLGKNLSESISRVLTYIETYKPKRAKIKIRPGIDVALIAAVRKKYPALPLTVDANASYTMNDVRTLKKLEKYNLLMIEQPLAYNDLVDHAGLQKIIKTPICLDESINSYHAAEEAISLRACRIINIKPQRVGGYWQAKRISGLAARHHIPVWCGGMIESGWGQLFNCHIATLSNFSYDNDICLTKWYLADDILEKSIVETDGRIDVPSTDALFHINKSKLKKYTVEKIVVRKGGI